MNEGTQIDERRDPEVYRSGELPAMSAMLDEVLRSSGIRELFDSYHRLVDISFAVIDPLSNVILSSPWRRICTQYHREHPVACARCMESHRRVTEKLRGGLPFLCQKCENGLTECAAPIHVEGKYVANFFAGQFLTEGQDETWFLRQAEALGFDLEDYLAAVHEVPLLSEQRVERVTDVAVRMARVIAQLALERKRAIHALGEREHAEAALRETEEQYLEAQKMAQVGHWSYNPASQVFAGSREAYRLYGFPPGSAPTLEDVVACIAEDEAERVLGSLLQVAQDGTEFNEKFDIHSHDRDETFTLWSVAQRELTEDGVPVIKGVLSNITELRQSEKILQMRARRAQGMLELFQLENVSDDVLINSALASLAEITESRLAFVGLVDDAEKVMRTHLLSSQAMDACAMQDRSTDFDIERSGLWGEAIRSLAPVVCNEYASSYPGKAGLPDGHVPLSRFVAIPVVRRGRAVLLAGLANKNEPYQEHDVAEVQIFLEGLWGRLNAARTQRERARLEEQLRASQKMEAIGLLAGGVAHDFNNLLSVILGCTSFILEDLPAAAPMRADIIEIKQAGERAAALTRQLLAFSRKQVVEPVVLDLNELVGSMEKMLRRLLGEDIDVVMTPAAGLGRVFADPGQLEQIVMNLVVNARDAMGQGGQLTMETRNVVLDKTDGEQRLEVQPGPYVMLAVSDSGCGMDRETCSRIFEPFFTTKERGKGTGLGLSTVFGIVKQNNGGIWVYSEPGHGTTFKIFLPRRDAPTPRPRRTRPSTVSRGGETVLLVEDEESVRRIATRILCGAGYKVLPTASGEEALRLARELGDELDLLLADVVMPRMSGPEIAERLRELRPSIKVLFMSGYTDDAIVRHGVLDASVHLVNKPFTAANLLEKVRKELDDP